MHEYSSSQKGGRAKVSMIESNTRNWEPYTQIETPCLVSMTKRNMLAGRMSQKSCDLHGVFSQSVPHCEYFLKLHKWRSGCNAAATIREAARFPGGPHHGGVLSC